MTQINPPAPFDRELAAILIEINKRVPSALSWEMVRALRMAPRAPIEELIGDRPIIHSERRIPGPQGGPDLLISVFKAASHTHGGPGIFHIHGGGMVMGNRFLGMEIVLEWVELTNAVAVSIEYRLAPEHPDPAPVEDCYAGLMWTSAHAQELGFDPARLLIVGSSAGGGLAAGVALLARDRAGPSLIGQVLICPMIDDRNDTISSRQIDGIGMWDRTSNAMGWKALLGARCNTDQASIYAAPARAKDLSNLPPAFIDVGSAEVFRDEDVAYASRIWACGGQAELHVWPGGFHGSNFIAPTASLSVAANTIRTNWIRRLLCS